MNAIAPVHPRATAPAAAQGPASALLTTNRKALTINLDDRIYGTFAEIGAGQEVARHFFQAGGAAGTVAKSMSAYDMKFSDAIYGKARRYVSKERMEQMLAHEYGLLIERLADSRGQNTHFFVFADTVAARSFKGTGESHGWLGVKFQRAPGGPAHEIHVHVRMLDPHNPEQQQALGVVGLNLIYGSLYFGGEVSAFIDSLDDNLSPGRLEVDMIEFHGPDFAGIDNRLASLALIEQGLTDAVLFGPDRKVLQPSEALYKKALLMERGSFRPVTHINIDMMECGLAQYREEPHLQGLDVLPLMEITLRNLKAQNEGQIEAEDFLARVDAIAALGYHVLISNYFEYWKLVAYFRRYTLLPLGIVLGINNLIDIFTERYYENLPGGILEAFGRLFKAGVRLYIYPMLGESFAKYASDTLTEAAPEGDRGELAGNALITVHNVRVSNHLRSLFAYLLENRFLESVYEFRRANMRIYSREVLGMLQRQEPTWEQHVPGPVAKLIKERCLWGYRGPDCLPVCGPAAPVAAVQNGAAAPGA